MPKWVKDIFADEIVILIFFAVMFALIFEAYDVLVSGKEFMVKDFSEGMAWLIGGGGAGMGARNLGNRLPNGEP